MSLQIKMAYRTLWFTILIVIIANTISEGWPS
jgi:hypothetical protein